MKHYIFLLAICGLIGLARQPAGARGIPIDGYAAIVDDRVITIGEVITYVAPIEEQIRMKYSGNELQAQLEKVFEMGLNALIEKALMIQDFKSGEGFIPEKMIESHIEKQITVDFSSDRNAFHKWLEERGIGQVEYEQQIRDQLTVMLQRKKEVLSKVQISPSLVKKVYEARKNDFKTPETVKLRVIVLNLGDGKEAREATRKKATVLRNRLQAGENFVKTAQQVSAGSNASKGGDWGWVKPGDFRKELSEGISATPEGEVSAVIETEEQIYLCKVEQRKEAGVMSYESLRDKIKDQIKREEENRLYREWIDRLKRTHYVKIYESM